MSSMWPSALASLDESLAELDGSLQLLEAARPVDLPHVIERLKMAVESSQHVRTLALSDVPDAKWDDREDLVVLFEARDLERRREQLSALADELERGNVVHRRAARVAQLTQLRGKAVEELRSLAAAEKAPPALPGPDAPHWIDWACNLKEPDDTASLQSLRAGFSRLDEFVASLEPGMWATSGSPKPEQPSVDPAAEARELAQRRARLLALASELERGEIVHHRALRVTQVNHLREQAIQELRLEAAVSKAPSTLPGPEAAEWMPWACTLKEPDDADALQKLRDGFPRVDEFVANLEPGMWVPASSAQAQAQPAPSESVAEPLRREDARAQKSGREAVQAAPVASAELSEPGFATVIPLETSSKPSFLSQLTPRVTSFARERWRVALPIAVLLLALLATMQWRLHRTHAENSPVKAAEAAAPDTSATSSGNPSTASAPASSPVSRPSESSDKNAKLKDASAATKTPAPQPPPPPEKQVAMLNDTSLRTPQAIPKNAALKADDAASGEAPGAVPGALPGAVSNAVPSIVKDAPINSPKLPAQKIRVSSGVAQGQLIHQVTPTYPVQARLAGIHGTVVLQAVIGKDGKVQNVRALRGPAMLVQPALDAVKQWRYKPFAVNGEPAEADIEVNVNFNQ